MPRVASAGPDAWLALVGDKRDPSGAALAGALLVRCFGPVDRLLRLLAADAGLPAYGALTMPWRILLR